MLHPELYDKFSLNILIKITRASLKQFLLGSEIFY